MSILPDFDMTTTSIGAVGENIHAGRDIIGALYQEYIDTDKYAFIEENLDDVRNDRFISPAHSQDIADRVLRDRFLLLSGKDRMGKAALSRHIADMIMQENSDKLSVKRIRQNFDLIDVLDDLILEKTQNHIILGYGININELQENIDILIQIAREKSKYIIFTSELPSSIPYDLQEFMIEVKINYPYTSQNIEQLLKQQLLKQYFQAENIEFGVELKDNIKNISKRLVSPSVAIRLAESLLKETTLPVYNQWVDRLNDLEDFSKEVKKWWSKLRKSERIFFLTLTLFNDLPEHNFWLIYETVIDVLKTRDHTLIELDYYAIEENREFVVSEPSIAFKHIQDRNIILLQLLKSYRRSLIKILSFLGEKIDEFKGKKDLQMRRAIAEAVGCIATIERESASDILYSWAKHEIMSVRAAVGYAHRQMIKIQVDSKNDALLWILKEMEGERYLNLAKKETNKEEKDDENSSEIFGPRWTVAASLGIINNYISEDRFEQKILPLLKELVYSDKNVRVRKAAIYSMRQIGLSRFKQIRPILADKAEEFNAAVQLEVAETLAKLSISKKSDVHQLLQEWLIGQNENRLWIAFYTLCLFDSRKEEKFSILQKQIYENANLQIKIIKSLNKILINEKLKDEEIVKVFNMIAINNDIPTNKKLIVEILSINIYKQGVANKIVDAWSGSADEKLNELSDIIIQRHDEYKDEMRRKRQHLLKNELDNNELLDDFSDRLPEDEKSDFWNEVNIKREERGIKQHEQQMNILIGIGSAIFVIIVIWLLT